ncbi:hypothetical protein ACFYZ2_12310 [Streptomyces sviceus]|uniref:HD domain-containing protein n=1 Tax=Streptomyces sviceus TaxID=285530 RepID=UPI00368CED46
MLEEDYRKIRKRHAAVSGEMILEDYERWGLPQGDYVLAGVVSLIARAHGTSEYTNTIPDLESYGDVRNTTVRAPLLAAILLMADELDLHYQRAGKIPDEINPTSEAHDFKHRCITSASIDMNKSKEIEIGIRLSTPPSINLEDREAIERWIVAKLRRQISLVEPQFVDVYGHGKFSRAIKVTRGHVAAPKMPSKEALSIIRSEAASDTLMDHSNCLATAEDLLKAGAKLILFEGSWDKGQAIDNDGAEDLLETIVRRADAKGYLTLRSRRLLINKAGEASEILEEWVKDIHTYTYSPPDRQVGEHARRISILDMLITGISRLPQETPILLTLSFMDGLEEDAKDWILREAIPKIIDSAPRICTLGTFSGNLTAQGPLQANVISVRSFEVAEVERYLQQYDPSPYSNILSTEFSYGAIKRIAINWEKRLRGV